MVAIGILLYSARMYQAGETAQDRAMLSEKIGTYGGITCLIVAVICLAVYGHFGCVIDSASAQLNALASIGCNTQAMSDSGASEMCVLRAMDCVDDVTYAASAQSLAGIVLAAAILL